MDVNTLNYVLSTIAQCAAALAALIGFLGMWRVDRLREQITRLEQHPKDDPTQACLPQLRRRQGCLLWVLRSFLVVTLLILGVAVVGFLYVNRATTWVWTPRLLWLAGVLLAGGPIVVVWIGARLSPLIIALALLVALTTPALAATRCTTYEEKTIQRLYTVCDDGTRAVSTYNKTLGRWETTITSPLGKTCEGRLNPRTRQWEGRCR
jgi:pheromone shutdown protein TraB